MFRRGVVGTIAGFVQTMAARRLKAPAGHNFGDE